MKKPKLIFGEDNGECSLWDIRLGEYNRYRQRIDKAYELNKDAKAEALEEELESHRIDIGNWDYEHGYVPNWAGYLAKAFDVDVESY